MYRAVECIEKEMTKFTHAHDPYSVGMREGMGDAADLVNEELRRIVQELEREARTHECHDPQQSCGLRKAIKILSGKLSIS